MEALWVRDRVQLWELQKSHPEWTIQQLSETLGRCTTWVKKWLKRLREEPPESYPDVFFSRSRAPKQPRRKVSDVIRDRILLIRDQPPENLRRIPGSVTILYYLHRQADLIEAGVDLPKSPRTIWRVLSEAGRIARPRSREHQPVERPEPDEVWAIDFKDISTVKADPKGKKQHVVEALNIVDEGTSRWIDVQVRDDFRMDTTIGALFSTFLLKGYPRGIKMDRDTRFIGSWSADEFPSALMRFLLCLGIDVTILPPRRPDLNPFVERLHRSIQEEVIRIERPATLEQAIEIFEVYHHHYSYERPNQALSCGNQPPLVAFPSLPGLPSLPDEVDPDAWLDAINRKVYKRRVTSNGSVQIGNQSYYISQKLAGQTVALAVQAAERQLRVVHGSSVIKALSIKGLFHGRLELSAFLRLMMQEAQTEERRFQRTRR